MKDKEKKIEELIYELKTAMCLYKSCEECPTSWCYAKECATMAIYKGYRKIPEDSVVLSREEYVDLSRNYVGEQVEQARKETAEKIFKMLISELGSNEFLYGKRIIMEVDVKNLAKQFGVEGEE